MKKEEEHIIPPVSGRKHIDIQTEQYLEEIVEPVIENDANVQTDPFMDRPTTPEFIPAKSGVDADTQVRIVTTNR